MTLRTPQRIFIVDDEPIIASTLEMIFRRAGFEAAAYTNPLALLRACEIQSPHAVLSDVTMPEMTGIELAGRLRGLYPDCKVILLSGYGRAFRSYQRNNPTLDILSKPIPPATLIRYVQSSLQTSNE